MAQWEASYIDRIAREVWVESGEAEPWYPAEESSLWLGYAVLVLVKGTATTSADVHEAWSAWAAVRYSGKHRSLIPFDELAPEIQAYDDLYRDAIHRVAARRVIAEE